MLNLIITAGSITTAVRIKKVLHSMGDKTASVIHTPSFINSGGCSYSVRTDYKNLDFIKTLASQNQIKYKKLYKESTDDGGINYHDIS